MSEKDRHSGILVTGQTVRAYSGVGGGCKGGGVGERQ